MWGCSNRCRRSSSGRTLYTGWRYFRLSCRRSKSNGRCGELADHFLKKFSDEAGSRCEVTSRGRLVRSSTGIPLRRRISSRNDRQVPPPSPVRFSQRRQLNRKYRQPVIQVLPNCFACTCSSNPHSSRKLPAHPLVNIRAPQPLHFAVLQKSQQFCLHAQRQLTHLSRNNVHPVPHESFPISIARRR